MKIKASALEAIAAHGKRGYPLEVCGALLARGGEITRAVELVNREPLRPEVRYEIGADELAQVALLARREGLELLGFYHTHPDAPARPSEADRRAAAAGLSDGAVHLVVSIERGAAARLEVAWIFRDRLQAFEPEPLELD